MDHRYGSPGGPAQGLHHGEHFPEDVNVPSKYPHPLQPRDHPQPSSPGLLISCSFHISAEDCAFSPLLLRGRKSGAPPSSAHQGALPPPCLPGPPLGAAVTDAQGQAAPVKKEGGVRWWRDREAQLQGQSFFISAGLQEPQAEREHSRFSNVGTKHLKKTAACHSQTRAKHLPGMPVPLGTHAWP